MPDGGRTDLIALNRIAAASEYPGPMRGSLTVATIFGTKVRVHFTFALLLIWVGAIHFGQGGWAGAFAGIAFILALFACVVAHEFGHILTARRYGIVTRDMILLPIGGLARLEHIPRIPQQELLVALAGPMVNLAIAAVLLILVGGFPESGWGSLIDPDAAFLDRLALANLLIAMFNMLPAFPMDGGRVLRALLAFRIDHGQATRIAANIGQGIAIAFGLLGLLGGNPLLIFIALFVYLGAGAEAMMGRLQHAIEGYLAGNAAITSLERLTSDQRIAEAADMLIRTTQKELPVVDGTGRFRGLVTAEGLVKGLREHGSEGMIGDIMRTDIATIAADAPLADCLDAMQNGAKPAVAVVRPDGGLAGLVTMENLSEFMLLRSAAAGSQRAMRA